MEHLIHINIEAYYIIAYLSIIMMKQLLQRMIYKAEKVGYLMCMQIHPLQVSFCKTVWAFSQGFETLSY